MCLPEHYHLNSPVLPISQVNDSPSATDSFLFLLENNLEKGDETQDSPDYLQRLGKQYIKNGKTAVKTVDLVLWVIHLKILHFPSSL